MVERKGKVETGKRDKGGVEERNEREEARLVRRAGDEGDNARDPTTQRGRKGEKKSVKQRANSEWRDRTEKKQKRVNNSLRQERKK